MTDKSILEHWLTLKAGQTITGPAVVGGGTPFKVRFNQTPVTVEVGRTRLGGGGFAVVYDGYYNGRPVALRFETQGDQRWLERQRTVLQIADLARRDPVVQSASVVTHKTFLKDVGLTDDHGAVVAKLTVWVDVMDRYQPIAMTNRGGVQRIAQPLGASATIRRVLPLLKAKQRVWDELRLIHRDIDPLNILVDSTGALRYTDWGIASLVQRDRTHTETRPMGKNWEYNAPEIFHTPPKTGPYTDAWSLGVLLLELATGKRPIIRPGQEPTIPKLAKPLPPRLRDTIGGLLFVDPYMRWNLSQAIDTLETRPIGWDAKHADDLLSSTRSLSSNIQRTTSPVARGQRAVSGLPVSTSGLAPAKRRSSTGLVTSLRRSIRKVVGSAVIVSLLGGAWSLASRVDLPDFSEEVSDECNSWSSSQVYNTDLEFTLQPEMAYGFFQAKPCNVTSDYLQISTSGRSTMTIHNADGKLLGKLSCRGSSKIRSIRVSDVDYAGSDSESGSVSIGCADYSRRMLQFSPLLSKNGYGEYMNDS